MRLICPNCGAQYEVPADVIPDTGRDVQCSNCGHTWFQRHPDQDIGLTEELNEPFPDTEYDPDQPEDLLPPAAADDTGGEAQRRGIDPEMAELFREERDFEANQRAADALESQPDLGLETPDENEQARRSRQVRERMARIRGEDAIADNLETMEEDGDTQIGEHDPAVAQAAAAAAAGSRRDLLPDVEEINQTLRSSSKPQTRETAESDDPDNPEQSGSSGGFRRGFMTIVLLVAIGAGVYVYAARITEAVPQSKPVLERYVQTIDAGRSALDGWVLNLKTKLDSMGPDLGDPDADPSANTGN